MTNTEMTFSQAIKYLSLNETQIIEITLRIAEELNISGADQLPAITDIVKNTIIELAKMS